MSLEGRTIPTQGARWAIRTAVTACALVGVYHLVVPMVVTREVRSRFADAGYPAARFELAHIGLSTLELEDVWLRDGLELGDVSVDAGLSQLWRDGAFDVHLRAPRVAVAARAELDAMTETSAKRLPVRRVNIDNGTVEVGGKAINVTGTIDLRRRYPAFDVTARTASLDLGRVHARDVVAEVKGRDGEVRACASGVIESALAKACTRAATLDLGSLSELPISWTARDAAANRWSASGEGRLVRTGGSFALRDGHADVTTEQTTIRAQLDGDLDGMSIRGSAHAARFQSDAVVLHDVTAPFAVRAVRTETGIVVTGEAPLIVRAATAAFDLRGTKVNIERPALTARGQLALAGGKVLLRTSATERADAVKLKLDVRGVALSPVLEVATAGRVRGTGILDGAIEIERAGDQWAITGGSMLARGKGNLRASDAQWRQRAVAAVGGYAVHHRVAAALGDFTYSRLAFVFGKNPDLQLQVRGRGRRIPQEINLVMNVRGLHGLANRVGLAQLRRTP